MLQITNYNSQTVRAAAVAFALHCIFSSTSVVVQAQGQGYWNNTKTKKYYNSCFSHPPPTTHLQVG
jgi:hypothetical protein